MKPAKADQVGMESVKRKTKKKESILERRFLKQLDRHQLPAYGKNVIINPKANNQIINVYKNFAILK